MTVFWNLLVLVVALLVSPGSIHASKPYASVASKSLLSSNKTASVRLLVANGTSLRDGEVEVNPGDSVGVQFCCTIDDECDPTTPPLGIEFFFSNVEAVFCSTIYTETEEGVVDTDSCLEFVLDGYIATMTFAAWQNTAGTMTTTLVAFAFCGEDLVGDSIDVIVPGANLVPQFKAAAPSYSPGENGGVGRAGWMNAGDAPTWQPTVTLELTDPALAAQYVSYFQLVNSITIQYNSVYGETYTALQSTGITLDYIGDLGGVPYSVFDTANVESGVPTLMEAFYDATSLSTFSCYTNATRSYPLASARYQAEFSTYVAVLGPKDGADDPNIVPLLVMPWSVDFRATATVPGSPKAAWTVNGGAESAAVGVPTTLPTWNGIIQEQYILGSVTDPNTGNICLCPLGYPTCKQLP